jgi:hypothetical protein
MFAKKKKKKKNFSKILYNILYILQILEKYMYLVIITLYHIPGDSA